MYNEFAYNITKESDPVRQKHYTTEKTLIGRLHRYFLIYFETFSAPTADTLFLLILSILALESAHSLILNNQYLFILSHF